MICQPKGGGYFRRGEGQTHEEGGGPPALSPSRRQRQFRQNSGQVRPRNMPALLTSFSMAKGIWRLEIHGQVP